MTWATPAEAKNITGQEITQEQLDAANAVIEIYVGVTETARHQLRPRDLRLLKKGEAFQAAWQAEQVDYTGRSDIDEVDHDGLRYSKADPDTFTLAPLAKAAISRLSWRRSRTLQALTPGQALALRGKRTPETIGIDADDLEVDDTGLTRWRPIR
ncbi:hypothetical protein [Actinomadura miaoliensis]